MSIWLCTRGGLFAARCERVMEIFRVFVYRPNGQRYGIYSQTCSRADVAIRRTKKKVYAEGRLAHFYSYVPVSSGVAVPL